MELLFFNSNIQLLKEEVSELNSSVHIYQHDRSVDANMLSHFDLCSFMNKKQKKKKKSFANHIMQQNKDVV